MLCGDGSISLSKKKIMSTLTSISTENTLIHAERFAYSVVIVVVDHLYTKSAFMDLLNKTQQKLVVGLV
jgi:hypothetical protein